MTKKTKMKIWIKVKIYMFKIYLKALKELINKHINLTK